MLYFPHKASSTEMSMAYNLEDSLCARNLSGEGVLI